ncbi:MAG: DUF6325 family protein [Candidatus Cybelea sp.]
MAQGPLEYYVIGFDGHRFSGEIAPAIEEAVVSGAIRVVDLVFVTKDVSGKVNRLEYQDFDGDVARAFAALDQNADGMFSGEDLDEIGSGLENDSSAALVLIEHLWARKIREAVLRANGRLIQNGILTEDAARIVEPTTA